MTKMYLSQYLDKKPNRPTTHQSSLTKNGNITAGHALDDNMTFEMFTDKNPFHSMYSLEIMSNMTTTRLNIFSGKWDFPIGSGVSQINSNTWTFYFAHRSSGASTYGHLDENKKIYLNVYIWRPGTGKLGTIFEGLSNAATNSYTPGTNYQVSQVTFSGSQITGIQSGDLIILEVWAQPHTISGTVSTSLYFNTGGYYDGYSDGQLFTGVSTLRAIAPWLETPQDIGTYSMAFSQKLYFHEALSPLSGNLPTTEQASWSNTFQDSSEAQNISRSMDETIGSSLFSRTVTLNSVSAIALNYYFTRFIYSEPLATQTIPSMPWMLYFGAKNNNSANQFVAGNNEAPADIVCYIWRPSTGAKVGDICNGQGLSTKTATEGSTLAWTNITVGFVGEELAIQEDDLLVYEAVFTIDPSTTDATRICYFAYDGTTTSFTLDGTTDSIASFLAPARPLLLKPDYITCTSDTKDILKQRPQQLITNTI